MKVRSALLAIGVLSAAGWVLLGTARGSEWREFLGSIEPGTPYLVPIPPSTEILEIQMISQTPNSTASLLLLSGSDDPVGYFTLDSHTTGVDVRSPREGVYILYVYSLKDSSLALRIRTPSEIGNLTLKKGSLFPVHEPLVQSEKGPVSKEIIVNVDRTPLLLDLSFTGVVENLSGVVETTQGVVLRVENVTGRGWAPGITHHEGGTIEFDPSVLVRGPFRSRIEAGDLQGKVYLTLLLAERTPLEGTPKPTFELQSLQPGQGVYVPLEKGDVLYLISRGKAPVLYSIFDPDDTLVHAGSLVAGSDVTVTASKEGEYVVYVACFDRVRSYDVRKGCSSSYESQRSDALLAVPKVRRAGVHNLSLVEGVLRTPTSLSSGHLNATFKRAPLEMGLSHYGVGAFTRIVLSSPKGRVVEWNSPLSLRGWGVGDGWVEEKGAPLDRTLLVGGSWTLDWERAFAGDLTWSFLTYERLGTSPTAP